jgi:hypothetical protein
VPAGAPDVCFMARFPGLMDLSRESHVETNVTVWPIFSALSADNLLTICEHALAPLGRVVFVSQYPILLSSALVLSCAFLRLTRFGSGHRDGPLYLGTAGLDVRQSGLWRSGI